MVDDNDFIMPEIEEEKNFLGKTVAYVYDGLSYESLADAEEVRERDRAKRAELGREHKKRIAEAERKHAEKQAEIKRRHDELAAAEEREREILEKYNECPEYRTWCVQTEQIRDVRETGVWIFKQSIDTGLSACVDLDSLESEMYETLREIDLMGYEVQSIVPVTSGAGGWEAFGDNRGGGAGWGFSFTSGVLITGRRKNAGSVRE